MVNNKRDYAKAFSPYTRTKPTTNGLKPSTSGSTTSITQSVGGSQTNIRVIVRVRPPNDIEIEKNSKTIIKVIGEKMLIFDPKEEDNPFFYQGVAQKGRDLLKKQNKELQFIFDRIFDNSSHNKDVFEGSTKDLISSLLEGYNCSVFAYGATGAGKTHTMIGSQVDPGITYRTVAELFSQIEEQSSHREFNLGVTYLEVYNEIVQDLLHKSDPLQIRDDGRSGMVIAGLKVITIHNAEELFNLLSRGNKNRTQHPTDANQESSRSHAVFQVYINIINKLDRQKKHVKLSMIDLAGSERASATGCKGARFKEGANINKSLLALGNCINNLADGVKHIPYRDSKLTRLLKDSLGGNCQTVMIANIAPCHLSYEDTYNTLRYADRAKKIKTCVKKNIVSCEMHVTEYVKLVEAQKREIDLLKQKLLSYESGAMQIRPEYKQIKENEEINKNLAQFTSKLLDLFQQKKTLNERMLSLESSDKILCCRIQYKKAADNRLHHLTTAIDAVTMGEQNSSGKSRVNKSLHYFKRQRESLKVQILATWKELCMIEEEIKELQSQIKSENLYEKLSDKINLKICEIERSRMQQQFEHTRKISSLQQCEMQSLYTIVKMMSSRLQNYYNLMRGHDILTDKMNQEFKQLIKLLEGVRNIKWSDLGESHQEEEGFYSLISLSIPQLEDPLNNEMPLHASFSTDDEIQIDEEKQQTSNILSSTFNTSPDEKEHLPIVKTNLHNVTITLDGNTKKEFDSQNVVTNKFTETNLNSTFHLKDKPMKKRALVEKNHQNHGTPTKRAKQALHLHKNGSLDKENNSSNSTPPKPSVMNAKSVAILNKLKAENPKSNLGSMASKVPQDKQKFLLTSQKKLNGKPKVVPVKPSTRVPW